MQKIQKESSKKWKYRHVLRHHPSHKEHARTSLIRKVKVGNLIGISMLIYLANIMLGLVYAVEYMRWAE